MHVTRIHEDPRVTRPYSELQWKAIDALGEAVDAELVRARRASHAGRRADVRVDRRHGRARVELHGALAEEARARRAAARAPRAALRAGRPVARRARASGTRASRCRAGRWACSGAPDGRAAVARRDALRRHDPAGHGVGRRCAALRRSARRAARAAARARDHRLRGRAGAARATRRHCRSNADPLQADLSKPGERARLAKLLLAGLDKPAGYVLPLKPDDEEATADITWVTSPWPLRRERLYALPGDSPLGLRLPLGSLPEIAALDERARSARRPVRAASGPAGARGAAGGAGAVAVLPHAVVKTALCVEARGGHLRVFLPPVARLEAFAALAAAIEDTAVALDARVTIEGYPPPRDPRVSVLAVTPDPGVIEVNIHPARTWKDLVAQHRDALRGGAARAARHREVHARRPPHRHGRRQPRDARRAHAGRQPAAAPARPVAQPHHLLAEPPVALVPVLGHVHRPDEPGPARGRGARRQALRARDRVPADGAQARRRHARPSSRGWSTGCCATCSPTSPATRTAPSSPSTSSTRPTVRPGAWACSSSAPSRCRRTTA